LIQILYIVQHLLIAIVSKINKYPNNTKADRTLSFIYEFLSRQWIKLYMPTSIFALRGLRNQVTPECALKTRPAEEESLPNYQLQLMTPRQEMANQEKVRKRLIKHAFLLYLDTILYCPPLMYMVRMLIALPDHNNVLQTLIVIMTLSSSLTRESASLMIPPGS
jgi:hypothetical protein